MSCRLVLSRRLQSTFPGYVCKFTVATSYDGVGWKALCAPGSSTPIEFGKKDAAWYQLVQFPPATGRMIRVYPTEHRTCCSLSIRLFSRPAFYLDVGAAKAVWASESADAEAGITNRALAGAWAVAWVGGGLSRRASPWLMATLVLGWNSQAVFCAVQLPHR